MTTSKIHSYCEKALLYLICFPCLHFVIKLVQSLKIGIWIIFSTPLTAYTAANGVIAVGHLVLLTLLLYFCYFVIFFLGDLPVARPAQIDRWLSIPVLRQLLLSSSAQRNRYLVLLASLGTLVIVFYWSTTTAVLYWSGALLMLLYFIRWEGQHPNSGIPTLLYLSFCVLLCGISLYRQQNYALFETGIPLLFAILCSLLFVGIWLLIKIRRAPSGSTRPDWHISLLLLGTMAFVYYFYVVLSTLNCYYDPMTEHSSYTATVQDKVDPYDGKYYLCVDYTGHKKGAGTLMRVSPKVHEAVQIGGTIHMHLHPGVFGWAWYHDDIHTRE